MAYTGKTLKGLVDYKKEYGLGYGVPRSGGTLGGQTAGGISPRYTKEYDWGRKKKTGIPGTDWQDIIGTMPSITGEQAAVGTPLSEYLSGILSGQPSEGYESMQGIYSQALEDYYQEAIYKPALQEFEEYTIPSVKEEYVATGAITGTEVADRIAKETGKFQQSMLGAKATLAYQDYMARNPGTAELLQAALAYLGIPMMAAYQKPSSTVTGPWGLGYDEYGKPTNPNWMGR